MERIFTGLMLMAAGGAITAKLTGIPALGLVAACVVLVFLPPSHDLAIRIKERQVRKGTHPESDGRTPAERSDAASINNCICPDCGAHGSLLSGPSGGFAQNILCEVCLMEFNVGFGFQTGAVIVHRTGMAGPQRAAVFGVTIDQHKEAVQ